MFLVVGKDEKKNTYRIRNKLGQEAVVSRDQLLGMYKQGEILNVTVHTRHSKTGDTKVISIRDTSNKKLIVTHVFNLGVLNKKVYRVEMPSVNDTYYMYERQFNNYWKSDYFINISAKDKGLNSTVKQVEAPVDLYKVSRLMLQYQKETMQNMINRDHSSRKVSVDTLKSDCKTVMGEIMYNAILYNTERRLKEGWSILLTSSGYSQLYPSLKLMNVDGIVHELFYKISEWEDHVDFDDTMDACDLYYDKYVKNKLIRDLVKRCPCKKYEFTYKNGMGSMFGDVNSNKTHKGKALGITENEFLINLNSIQKQFTEAYKNDIQKVSRQKVIESMFIKDVCLQKRYPNMKNDPKAVPMNLEIMPNLKKLVDKYKKLGGWRTDEDLIDLAYYMITEQ